MSLHKIHSSDPISRHTHTGDITYGNRKSQSSVLAPPLVHLSLVSMNGGWILSRPLLLSHGLFVRIRESRENTVVRSDLHPRITPSSRYILHCTSGRRTAAFHQTLVCTSHSLSTVPIVTPGVVHSTCHEGVMSTAMQTYDRSYTLP